MDVKSGFLPEIGTIRACIDCGVLVSGGPTRCVICADKARQEPSPEISKVLEAVSDLYGVYFRADSDVARHRIDIESCLADLMQAWDRYLN